MSLPDRLLRLLLPPGPRGDHILRELHRERDRRARDGGRPPRLWYLGEALSLGAHFLAYRFETLLSTGTARTMDALRHHLRVALRRLRRDPAFAAVATLTTALGIGATVAIYSVVDAVLLDPLPYEEPGELVALWEWNLPRERDSNVINPGNFKDWRERTETVAEMAALTLPQPLVLTGAGDPREVTTVLATPNTFALLGVDARVGRTFSADAGERDGRESVLSHAFWLEAFGGDPEVVGRTLTIQGETTVVVGVLPPVTIPFGEGADLFASYLVQGDQTSTGRFLYAVGRLAPGATVERAQVEMTSIAAGLEEAYPDFNGGWTARVVPLRDELVGEVGPVLWLLLGACGLLLLIACANVANLLLARATEREREMAVRTSLGAGRGTLAGQLLVESLVLAGTGALLGVGMAWVAVRVAAGRLPAAFDLPRASGIAVDGDVMLVAVAVTALTGLAFGVVPALQAASVPAAGTLGRRGPGEGRASGRIRSALVAGEVALSVILLAGAALLGRSLVALTRVDPGLDEPASVLTARVSLSGPAYEGEEPDVRFFTELVDRAAALPGVESAGAVTFLPMAGPGAATSFFPGADPDRPRPEWPAADVRNVAGAYFEAMGIRLLEGRAFDGRDRPETRPVVVVNRTLADRWWPEEGAVGRTLRLSWGEILELEVVGVVEDVRFRGPAVEPREAVYLPYAQATFFSSLALVVRSTRDPADLVPALEAELAALDPGLPLSRVERLSDRVDRAVARPRATAALMAAFAGVAALLAVLGVYGVLAYTVARRVREIGVRRAVGADAGAVVRLVFRQGMAWVVAGLAVGLAGAVALAGVMETLLFGVATRDPLSLAGSAALLLAAGAAACLLPAWRALRVSPVTALRSE